MTTLSPEPPPGSAPTGTTVLTDHGALLAFLAAVFTRRGVPRDRAVEAARALCHGDLAGMDSHGVANLTRLYLPLLDEGRADPRANLRILTDLGAAVLLDARRSLGLWAGPDAMDLAVERAEHHGVGLVSVRGATHLGCAGYSALRAAERGLIGVGREHGGGPAQPPAAGGRGDPGGPHPAGGGGPGGRPPAVPAGHEYYGRPHRPGPPGRAGGAVAAGGGAVR